jgi:hypothetical protein
MMVVDVEPGPVPRFSAPREPLRHPIEDFAVTSDGQRFIGLSPAGDITQPLTLIANRARAIPQ